MKVSSASFNKSLLRIKRDIFGDGFPKMEPPLRSELLSADQMEEHGKNLAETHTLSSRFILDQYLLTRLTENGAVLIEVRDLITDAVKANRQIYPAAEWLLDNFYLIQEHIHNGKRHLPKSYSRELPRLRYGPSKGLPRVYDIALEMISHGDGRVDPESLSRFVSAYQSVSVLKLGELWAIPIMLRLTLIENLRRVAVVVANNTLERNLADSWADKLMEVSEKDPKNLILVIADMARSSPPLTTSFVSEFVRRLQGQSPALALPLTWIEQHLSESGLNIERLIHLGNQQQASDQISIRNSIESLRFMGAMDWKEFVETMSAVEQKLRFDPSGAYSRMDFVTRDNYRHIIEKIAKRSPYSEEEIAHKAISLTMNIFDKKGETDREAHVGYYLIDKGFPQLNTAADVRISAFTAISRFCSEKSLWLYAGSFLLIAGITTAGLMTHIDTGTIYVWISVIAALSIFISLLHPAITIVNWLSTLLVKPSLLPRMDFSHGIPPESRSLVVIPSMVISTQNIEDLVEGLEVRFLANQDENLHFGLLTDFLDAEKEILPEDDSLLKLVIRRIEALNNKYNSNTFFLFHRPRHWNPAERVWMGYERKRGKLSDLNSLILGQNRSSFSAIVGNTELLTNVRYVITLDSDTQLPRDSAKQFVGTMAHPLNRAKYNEKKNRVTEGYGIIQPRIAVSLSLTNTSRYSTLYGSEPGIDPYTRAVSDVYQDIFSEGSFIGKGIYDVEVFNRVFDKRFPENRILSHDLLEGCYARSGLITDVQLFEEYPASYFSDVKRRHRWIRGDWQILKWLLPYVKDPERKYQRNPLSGLSKWKILDNLRRSITPLAFMFLLIAGWTVLSRPMFWTIAVIIFILTPPILISLVDLLNKPKEIWLRQHLKTSAESASIHFFQSVFTLICLPFEAVLSFDAIIRTFWRILISHRKLLEWNPSIIDQHGRASSILNAYRIMWTSPFISLIVITILAVWWPENLMIIWLIPLIWAASPAIIWWINNKPERKFVRLSESQKLFLRDISRKTWTFFEYFVGPGDNWLPPDNFQEQPYPIVAHRTSPTNIGLSLLANLTAYDFGYIHAGQFAERTYDTFNTLERMERYKGHFYNWYDTQSLNPLNPRYISSVDSGNFVGNIMILKYGLLEISDQKIINPRLFEGISDTFRNLVKVIKSGVVPRGIQEFRKNLKLALENEKQSLSILHMYMEQLTVSADEIESSFISEPDEQSLWWATAMSRQCRNALDYLKLLTPWIQHLESESTLNEIPLLEEIPTFRELADFEERIKPALEHWLTRNTSSDSRAYAGNLEKLILQASITAKNQILKLEDLAFRSDELSNIDYEFLYDRSRHLQNIGYNADERIKDPSYYDLLASEARFSTFIGIAQGKLPQESWFSLNRSITISGGDPVLLSWSGSMFEYLMPLLIMPSYENTLLDQTYKSAVKRQIEYGNQRGTPWGISESGYNMVDIHLNYQYKAFGVPGMGLKRGLDDDLVIAPYASMLALMVSPEEACRNLERLSSEKMEGKFGFYESMDYTSSRLNRGQSVAYIRSYMAHHQGMGFLSLSSLILDHPMQKRFESEPLFQATLLLLQERIPKTTAYYSYDSGNIELRHEEVSEMPVRVIDNPDTLIPEIHLLSNGRYHVMITNAGGGYSSWNNMAVTRWREDVTCDNWGIFCYIKDSQSGEYWSAAYQPTLKRPEKYEAIFSKGRAEFRRRDNGLDTHTEIVVSPEDDIELRRVRITNLSNSRRIIEITSYSEVVLASSAADAIHPAFSNLFVQTEIINHKQTILCTRRPRSAEERAPWMVHLMTVQGAEIKEISYETDRMKFLGRGNSPAAPGAMKNSGPLSGSQGSVLDPVAAIRYQIVLNPEESAKIDMVYGISDNRETALGMADKYQDFRFADRAIELAWTYSQLILTQINASEADAQLYGRLASTLIYANPSLRASSGILTSNRRGQSGLWGYSISGDYPIILLKIEDPDNINIVRQLVQAHAYWRLKGLTIDLVIWNEDHAGYRQLLHDQIMGLIAAGLEANVIDRPGGIFVRAADQISNEDKILIQAVARAIITDRRGSLSEQITRRTVTDNPVARFKPSRIYKPDYRSVKPLPRPDLLFYNGIGGFTQDGREYVITTSIEQITPAPWSNVIANSRFGSVITDNGNSYTWSENAHEIRLTPWNNDPVNDTGGEVLYIRDEENGNFWSPTPLPVRGIGTYVCRHGFGYSVFEHIEDGIRSELWIYVATDAPVKFFVLKIKNESGRPRRLSVTSYVEWVLGDLRPKSAVQVITGVDPGSGAVFARNPYNTEFGERTAFLHTDEAYGNLTCDRTEFIGRNRSLRNPAAMNQTRLSGKTGAGLDPCAAIQVSFDLLDGQEREIIFRLGTGRNAEEAGKLVRRFWGSNSARNALEEVWKFWRNTLGAIQIETPDQSVNLMINGWTLYQTIACRLWARSGFYQSGGAFGFRDQLQDMMAVIHVAPHLVREHLLLCASRQFKEGDVQHWWHPPSGRGVRTHCSDDYLWLPAVTCRYVIQTGDTGVLDEQVPFLEGYTVNPNDESYYDLPGRSEEKESLYQHCVRAINNGLKFGKHGVPLIGSGDWNDGMNRVGNEGKGESVWLGFFLYDVLIQFTRISEMHRDEGFAKHCTDEANKIRKNLNKNCWDGEWYLRAWFDNGTPLGSSDNAECQIDSIAQSWSVLSGAGDADRMRIAMDSVDSRLVRRKDSLIQLLDPPFDKSDLNPGYIKGYVPGVRENGGQYTHAAIWAAMAFARINDKKRAWDLMNIMNPVNNSATPEKIATYKVEPFVMAADVYAVSPHTGRGGWTWYTGSAGLMYRLAIESLIGLRLEINRLYFDPCLPQEWKTIKIHYRYRETMYHIAIIQLLELSNDINIIVDDRMVSEKYIDMVNDYTDHVAEVRIALKYADMKKHSELT